jgi:hypothetical protein
VLGRVTPEGLLIVATPWRQHLARLCAEVAETAEELTDASRLRVREDSREGGQTAQTSP